MIAPLAPSAAETVASGEGPRPAAGRASAISDAVRAAVPDGASTLRAWCSSTISAESKNCAAWAANRIMSTAPSEKFGTTSARVAGASASHPVTCEVRDSSKPEVPTTVSSPWPMHQRRLSMTTPGCVKSTTTSHPASASRESPSSTVATTSRSPAAATAWQTSDPIRPLAPSTPTLIMPSAPCLSAQCLSAQCRSAQCRSTQSLGERGVIVVRADHGEHLGPGEHLRGDATHVIVSHRLDRGEDLVDWLKPRVGQLGLAEAAHPRRGVFEAEHDRPAQLALAALQFGVIQPARDHLGHLVPADREHLVGLGRQATDVHAPDAGVGVLGGEAVHRVGEPALLPYLLEQPGGHAAAQRRVQHAEREPPVVRPGQALTAEYQVGLLDTSRDEPHPSAGRG